MGDLCSEKVLRAFGSVVQAKFEYEYSGDVFTLAAARRLLVKAETLLRLGTGTTALTQAITARARPVPWKCAESKRLAVLRRYAWQA